MIELRDRVRGDLVILLAATLMDAPPGPALLDDVVEALEDFFEARGLAEELQEAAGGDLGESLLEVLEGPALDAEDAGERPDLERLLLALDRWFRKVGVTWLETAPRERSLPGELWSASEEVLAGIARESADPEHATEVSEAGERRWAGALLEKTGMPRSRSEQEAVGWLLRQLLSERWDPWPEEADGRLLAAVLHHRERQRP